MRGATAANGAARRVGPTAPTMAELVRELTRKHPRVRAHCHAVAVLAVWIARELGPADAEAPVRLAGQVHDLGKLVVPSAVLDKPGPLTQAEWRLVRLHPGEGERLLRPVCAGWSEVLAGVRSHHERWDGRGYPDGLVGTEIPLAARIVAVADAFHAMLETRPYRPERSPAEALEELDEHAGSQFDPRCVAALRLAVEGQPTATAAGTR